MAQLKGTWQFHDVLTRPSASFDTPVSFAFAIYPVLASTGVTGKGFRIKANVSASDSRWALYYSYHMYYGSGEVLENFSRSVYSVTDEAWITADGEEFRTVDFGTEPQSVSDAFYTWFTANADPVQVSVRYNGRSIASISHGQTATLKCFAMRMDDNVVVEVKEQTGETGSEPVFQEKTATENGEVTPDEGYDGLSKVTVKLPTYDMRVRVI